jgi:hypothetical protein
MHAIGSDRTRTAGGKVILQSTIPKGWTPRVARTNTSAEFPGTAVMWEGEHFEVLEATPLPTGGVRYVLAPWRDEHTIRILEHYDEASEAQRHADFERARRQRQASVASRLSGIFLGHLPEPVQNHLRDELGVTPSNMTLLSCLLPLAALGTCVWMEVGAVLEQRLSPVPAWLWLILLYLLVETGIRFYLAMSQNRGMGSLIGSVFYLVYWPLARKRTQLPSPYASRGETFTPTILEPAADIALRDELQLKGPLLTLLTAAEQQELAQRYGFDYRRHAFGLTWGILVAAILGVVTSYITVSTAATFSAGLSMFCAAAVAIEQVLRLVTLQRRPAGSIFAVLVRPFVRTLFTARK